MVYSSPKSSDQAECCSQLSISTLLGTGRLAAGVLEIEYAHYAMASTEPGYSLILRWYSASADGVPGNDLDIGKLPDLLSHPRHHRLPHCCVVEYGSNFRLRRDRFEKPHGLDDMLAPRTPVMFLLPSKP
jgi:hypothetical protein